MGDATVVVVVFLNEITRRARNEIGDFLHIALGVELFDEGCAELEIDAALLEHLHALQNFAHIDIVNADGVSVFFGAVFDVHCNVIDELVVQNLFEDVGAQAVGVELGGVAHASHLCQKVAKVGLQRRLAARHAHGVNKPFTLLKVIKNFVLVDLLCLDVANHERGVVTKRTAEIATARKDGASDCSVEVYHRKFFVSAKYHSYILARLCRLAKVFAHFTILGGGDILFFGETMKKKVAKQYLSTLLKLFGIFFKIGLFSFGGGYAMLSLIEAELVKKQKWITHDELADIFAIAESTPGPIAINTATYIGVKKCGVLGGIVATLGVVIPSLVVIVALSYVIELVKDNVWAGYFFKSIRVGVLVLIAKAVFTFFKDMRKNVISFSLMIASFLLVLLTSVRVIYIILASIIIACVAGAIKRVYDKKILHSVGTCEYFNERIDRTLEKDEYVRENTLYQPFLTDKTLDMQTDKQIALATRNTKNGKEGKIE